MINIRKQFLIQNGDAPYSYNWAVPDLCSNVSIDTGVTPGAITADFSFASESCLEENNTFSLNVVDSLGCIFTYEYSVANPCGEFLLSNINQLQDYRFNVAAAQIGCDSTTFEWIYDTAYFTSEESFDGLHTSSVRLKPIPNINNYPSSSILKVRATDCFGCTRETQITFSICRPTPQNLTVELNCFNDNYRSNVFEIPRPEGCNIDTNWSTVRFQAGPGFALIPAPEYGVNFFYISSVVSIPSGLYSGFYTVRDVEGVLSNTGSISMIARACDPSTQVLIPNEVFQVPCELQINDSFLVDITDRILTDLPLDWSTFQVVTPPNPLSQIIEHVVDLQGRHYIRYVVPTVLGTDAFQWTVCAENGQCAVAAVYTMILQCPEQPTAEDDNVCINCNEPVVINVLNNDRFGSALFLLNSITILTQPTKGFCSTPGDGTIIYTPFPNAEGADVFTYTVRNVQGSVSNEAIVQVEILCAGVDTNVLICSV
jgi:hypothetical protein